MDTKKVLLLVGALVVAGFSAMTVKNILAGSTAPAAQAAPAVPVGPKVLVATRALPTGTIIDESMVGYQPWPQELVQNAYYRDDSPDGALDVIIGTVVRTPINAGQPLVRGQIVGPEDRGFLAAALGPGMRAVTINTNIISGVGGFIYPGDRVDVMLSQNVNGDGSGEALRVTETIIRNVRVLATDQRVNDRDAEGKPVGPMVSSTVTIEVTPRLAEKISVATKIGEISLALRSLADSGADFEKAIAKGEIKMPNGADPEEERRLMASYSARPQDGNGTYTTSGHVSRFKPKSAPDAKAAERAAVVATSSGPTVRVSRGTRVSYETAEGR